MDDVMRRGRSQTIWRYAPGATFRYGESGAWCQTTGITLRDPKRLQGALAEAVRQALLRWNAIAPAGAFPDPETHPAKYAVGAPYQVTYQLWPLVFTCRRCGRLHYYQTLENLKRSNEALGCDSCKGRDFLRQVPYAFVCECGRLDTVFAPSHPRDHPITLVNKGNFQESYWYCTVCKRSLARTPREGLGFRRCECAPGKMKRGILLEDGRVYYAQTIDLVEVEPKTLDPWRDNAGFSELLLGAVLGIPAYRPSHIQDLASRQPGDHELSPELRAMREELVAGGMPAEQAEAMVRRVAGRAGADAWTAYETELAPYRGWVGGYDRKSQRRTVEYVFVRDDPSTAAIALDQLICEARDYGDEGTAERLEREREIAGQIGLINLRVVQALPVLLAGIGYTRYKQSPGDTDDGDTASSGPPAALRPYREQDGKIPIYVARNDTEALLYEVDPWRLAAFLSLNTGTAVPPEATASTPAIRAWLLGQCGRLLERGESHLVLQSWEIEAGQTVDRPSALVFGVLHTLSHVLKATAHRYVGVDADSLAEYLFPAHAAGLLYASSQVEFTLGGIDAVFRSNLTQWLGSARDYAGRCSFDPVCERSGGACLACLYPKFGCGYFNRTVSRAFLLGGSIAGRSARLEGFWSARVAEVTHELRARSGGG